MQSKMTSHGTYWCRLQPSGAAEDEDRTGTPRGWRWSCFTGYFPPSRYLTCISVWLKKTVALFMTPGSQNHGRLEVRSLEDFLLSL